MTAWALSVQRLLTPDLWRGLLAAVAAHGDASELDEVCEGWGGVVWVEVVWCGVVWVEVVWCGVVWVRMCLRTDGRGGGAQRSSACSHCAATCAS